MFCARFRARGGSPKGTRKQAGRVEKTVKRAKAAARITLKHLIRQARKWA